METIINYVDNVFNQLPDTKELQAIKEDIKNNMIEKFEELIAKGQSEHEAIGMVISEFGNINELLDELGINYKEMESTKPAVSLSTAKSYVETIFHASSLYTLGVALCILSAAVYSLFEGFVENKQLTILLDSDGDSILGVAAFFLCIIVAVCLFIYGSTKTKPYDYIEKGIQIDCGTKEYLKSQLDLYEPSYTKCLLSGIIFCLLSPLFYFLPELIFGEDSAFAAVPFLCVVTIGVSLLVSCNIRKSAYTDLLEGAQITIEKAKKTVNKAYTSVNSIILLLATIVMLILGFCFDSFKSAGMIYSIAGLLCAIASIIIWAFEKE